MSDRFDASVVSALRDLEGRGLLRTPQEVRGAQGPTLEIGGRTVVGLCSNDYLGLAAHPALVKATTEALALEGLGSGASRHISGNHGLHRRLEERLAQFCKLENTLLFSSGYAANLGTLQCLAGPGDGIFSDALNHASIIDGCRLSRAETRVIPHLDLAALQESLAANRARFDNAFVVTETLFSMDGDCPDLPAVAALCARYDAALVADEAHALGVLGPQGRGLCQQHGLRPDVLIGTLGKAFGCSGAFVAGRRETLRLVENRARSFVFSTAPPPALAAAAIAATSLVEAADDGRSRLAAHGKRLREGLRSLGFVVPPGDGPIVPVHLGDAGRTMEASARLLEAGVFVHGIRPPTVPEGTSRLRATAIATHSDAHIDRALEAFGSLVS